MIVVALQNLVAYSVNMLDNIMLGSYSQSALSGAATVNQIFFIVNQLALSIGNALVAMSSQYWGKKETEPVRKISAWAMLTGFFIALMLFILASLFPTQLLGLFTTDRRLSKPVFPIWRSSGLLTFSLR